MITFLFRTLIYLLSSAAGLVVADLLLDGFHIEWSQWWGFLLCVAIFTVLQSVLSPWIAKMASRYVPALMGGIGIVSTLVSLIVVVLLPVGGVAISSPMAWILGPVVVWVITAVASVVLPLIFLKDEASDAKKRAKTDKKRR